MSKTTTKKSKKTPTRTNKSTVAQKTTKTIGKKSVAVTKKITETAPKKVVKPVVTAATPLSPGLDNVKKFFANQKNVVILVAALLFLGVGYLLKDIFVVAMVNGKPVYRWTVIQRLEEQGGRQILDSIITEKLVKQAIDSSGIKVEQAEIDAAIKEIEDRILAQGMSLDQALADQGMTKDQLIEDIVLQKSAEKIVADKIEITEEEVDAYMEENKEFFPEGSDLDSMRELVKEQLKSSKINEEIQNWVQGIQDEAKIIYLKEYSAAL